MASYNELNALIDAYINRNGVQAITGQILNGVLKAMVEQLGRGYTIMGAAIPTTDPGTPDGPECYFASETGTYTDFDGLQVAPGELALLCYTPSDGWTKATIYEGFQEVGATIDGNVGTPSVGVSYANGVLSFDFHNMKGNPGQNGQDGQDGAAAGFGTIGADITGGVGTPGVTVESSGPATAKNLQFHFTNLKGETGVTSVVATVDNTTGTPACTVSLVGQQLTLAFSGLKGAQGNTGSSVDYPYELVNNLTTDDATKGLTAAQGKVLDGKVSQLEAKVTEKTGGEVAPPLSLEQGGISSATGANSVSTTRLRTSNYITADGISIVTSGNKVYVMGYKDDGTYVDANGWLSSSQEVRITGATKYRLVFAFSNDDTINVGDFDTLGIAIKSVYDGKLATKAALALTDAKVGILEDKANDLKLPVYGGSQVITYIDGEYVNPSTGSFTHYTGWSRTGYLNVQGLANLEYINPGEDSTYNAFYDKDKVFISGFRTFKRTTLATVSVPTNAVWCVLSNTSVAIRQLTLPNLRAFSGIVVLEDNVKKLSGQSQNNRINTATSINDIEEYVALQQAVRIDFILSILLNARIQISVTSDYRVSYSLQEADGTTLYDSAWVTSVNLQDTLYNYPTASRIRLYFKKADGSDTSLEDIKSNAVSEMVVDYVASEWGSYPDLTIENSILKDIHDLALGGSGILDLNPEKEVVPKLGNLTRRYISYGGSATEHPPVLSFIHMSDAHADNENILRIKSFYDKYSEYLNGGVIDTGDFIGQNLAQGLPSSISEVSDFIRILGNHDAYYYVNSTWQLAPQLDCYNVCFKDYIGNWGVVQPENAATYGYCYFYKDFSGSGVMMVALDYDHWDATQNTWLINTLSTALSLERHIIILVHRAPFRITADTSNPFQNIDYINKTFADHSPMTDVYTDVKNFIDAGGNFVCYLCGHLHDDYFGLGRDTDTNNQLVIGVGCVSDAVSATVSGTMSRIAGQKSQDCFNVVGVDTASKTIKIMRIGADYDRYMRKKNTLSWNYGTGQLIYVD